MSNSSCRMSRSTRELNGSSWEKIMRSFGVICRCIQMRRRLDHLPVKGNSILVNHFIWFIIKIRNKYCVEQEYGNCDCYTQCWPRDWLPQDFNALRVVGINYDTSLSMWAPICPLEHVKTNIEERSRELLKQLIDTGLGKRPIIWVTHSMGGLIVKRMLTEGTILCASDKTKRQF